MRIFISTPDETGSHKTTRLSLVNCSDTSQLIKIICKQLNVNKNAFIFLLKNQLVNLRILQNWPLSTYGVKNGSWILMNQNQFFSKKELSNSSTASLQKIEENQQDIASQVQNSSNSSQKYVSFFNLKSQDNYQDYFQKELSKMLAYVRESKLQQIALMLKEQPDIEDESLRESIMRKKNEYVLNQVGQCGRNCLHWAIHTQNIEMVTFLLMKFTDPTTQSIDQYTPLQLAILHRNLNITQILLSQPKVDPNMLTIHGTALHLATDHQCVQLVKILLQNGASPDQMNKDGKRPVQLSQLKQIIRLFQDNDKKLSLRLLKPNITRGSILKVSALTFRGKVRTVTINPFKDAFTVLKQNDMVELQLKIKSIRRVQRMTERSWLMESKLSYVRITYDFQEGEQKLLIGIRHPQILGKWLAAIQLARLYTANQKHVTRIQPEMQLIEVLDDSKNQIKVHKRQVEGKKALSPSKPKYSIIDMKVSEQTQQPQGCEVAKIQSTRQVHYQEQFDRSFLTENEDNYLRQSQIHIGSILMQKSLDSPQTRSNLSTRNTVSGPSIMKNSIFQENQYSSHPARLSNFRKKSTDISIISQFQLEQKKKVTFKDFEFNKQLGSGAFGKVYLTRHAKSGNIFAMKVLNKKRLMAKKQLKYAVSQTNILKRVQHPFIICLHYSFQTPSNLYLALDYCPCGDLSEILCEKQRFTQLTARFIIAQVVLAIQYLHGQQIIYRDLKPENILVAKDGYLKLIDFGLSKENHFAKSFCGSPAYLSPEMLQKKGHGFPTDIYGLGCVLYQMVIGEPPFYDENMDQMFDNIKSARLKFPGFLTKQIKSLLTRMLERDTRKRIGASDMAQIKSHQFFSGFSWQKLLKKELKVPKQLLPQSIQADYFELQNKIDAQNIKYVDQDYTDASMLNRIKGFSFSRQNKP